MNFSTVIGFGLAIGVFLHSVLTSTDNRAIFMNTHGIVIVMGGTIAAGAICFPIGKIMSLGFMAIRRMLFGEQVQYANVIRGIIELSEKSRADANFLKKEVDNLKFSHPFLKESLQLVNDGLPAEEIRELLEQRILTQFERYKIEANIFKTLSKFPPAFGLLGTTLGMIALLQKLGGENASKEIGPAMSIGLVATLYGISLANFILIPIGESLSEKNRADTTLRRVILEGVLLIKAKVHPLMIAEKLNSYLTPSERISRRDAKVAEAAKAPPKSPGA